MTKTKPVTADLAAPADQAQAVIQAPHEGGVYVNEGGVLRRLPYGGGYGEEPVVDDAAQSTQQLDPEA